MINWMLTEIDNLKKMDTKTRKLITCHRMHHSRAVIEHLCIKRENGRRGLIQLEPTYKTTAKVAKKYLDTTIDWMQQLVNTQVTKEKNLQLVKKVMNFLNNLTLHQKR